MPTPRRPLLVTEGERNSIRRWLRLVFRGQDGIVVRRQAEGEVVIGQDKSLWRGRAVMPPLHLGIVKQDDDAGQSQGTATTGSTVKYAVYKPGDDTETYDNALGRHLAPVDREVPGKMTIAAAGSPCLYYFETDEQGDKVLRLYDAADEMPVTTTCNTGGA